MNERKLTNIDFKELLPYVEDRGKDFDTTGRGGMSAYIRYLVQQDKERQDGQEAKTGKTAQRIIRKVENMNEDEQRKLYNFIREWC